MSTFRVVGQPILIAILLALAVRSAVRIYSIPTSSMEPTLRVGDHILVIPYHGQSPQRGDVIVFRSPVNREELFVKRIVATPGDLVASRGGQMFVGGHALAEAYVSTQRDTGAIAAQIVPSDSYFVLGDNRANSFDSRQWGALPRNLLVGRARLVLWSSGSGAMHPRANATPISRGALRPTDLPVDRLFKRIE